MDTGRSETEREIPASFGIERFLHGLVVEHAFVGERCGLHTAGNSRIVRFENRSYRTGPLLSRAVYRRRRLSQSGLDGLVEDPVVYSGTQHLVAALKALVIAYEPG